MLNIIILKGGEKKDVWGENNKKKKKSKAAEGQQSWENLLQGRRK